MVQVRPTPGQKKTIVTKRARRGLFACPSGCTLPTRWITTLSSRASWTAFFFFFSTSVVYRLFMYSRKFMQRILLGFKNYPRAPAGGAFFFFRENFHEIFLGGWKICSPSLWRKNFLKKEGGRALHQIGLNWIFFQPSVPRLKLKKKYFSE